MTQRTIGEIIELVKKVGYTMTWGYNEMSRLPVQKWKNKFHGKTIWFDEYDSPRHGFALEITLQGHDWKLIDGMNYAISNCEGMKIILDQYLNLRVEDSNLPLSVLMFFKDIEALCCNIIHRESHRYYSK